MRRVLLLAVLATVLGILASHLVVGTSAPELRAVGSADAPAPVVPGSDSLAELEDMPPEREPTDRPAPERVGTTVPVDSVADARARALASYTATFEPGVFFQEWVHEQHQGVFEGVPEDYARKRAAADAGDAEAAFEIYMLIKRCMGSPYTEWQLTQSVQRLEQRLLELSEEADGEADRVLEAIDAVHRAHEFCAVLDGANTNLAADALRWLDRTADLGHMGAQRLYHAHARELLTNDDSSLAFRSPGLIEQFQARSDQYVRRLLMAGNPQGLSLMSRMLTIGDVYDRDPLMAYAYARATELVGDGRLVEEARARMAWVARHVPPEDQQEAERIARDIVRAWRGHESQ